MSWFWIGPFPKEEYKGVASCPLDLRYKYVDNQLPLGHINTMLLRWWWVLLFYFVYLQFCTSLPQLIHSAYSFLSSDMPCHWLIKNSCRGLLWIGLKFILPPLFWGRATFLLCLYTHCCLIAVQWSYLLSLAQQFWNGNVRWKVGAHISTTNSHTFWPKG